MKIRNELVEVYIRRARIQFEDCDHEHSTGKEVREHANAWAAECTKILAGKGFVCDVEADYSKDCDKFFICVSVGDLEIFCNWRGSLKQLTPAQSRFITTILESINEADDAGRETARACCY